MGKIKIVPNFSYTSVNLGNITFCDNTDINMLLITANEDLTISFTRDLEYNDGSSIFWKVLEANTELEVLTDNTVAFKSNIIPRQGEGCGTFTISGEFKVSGNLLALIDRNVFVDYAFKGLFENCTTLVDASELYLPNTVTIGCYESMFKGCTSLIAAPILNARSLEEDCYKQLFYGCSSLSNIKCYNHDSVSDYFSTDWVTGVAATGIFELNFKGEWSAAVKSEYIPNGWTINDDFNKPHDNEYFTVEILNDGLFTFGPCQEGTFNYYPEDFTISYNINNGGWVTTIVPQECITLEVLTGDKIKFKGTNTRYCNNQGSNPQKQWFFVFGPGGLECSGSNYTKSTSHFNVYGNIMSLLYGDNFLNQTTLTAKFVFCSLFKGSLVESAENLVLPATTLLESCYRAMFSKANYLTISPSFIATELVTDCYKYMFENTYNLQQITCLAESGLNTDSSINYFISVIQKGAHGTFPQNGTFIKSPNIGASSIGSSTEWTIASPSAVSAANIQVSGIPDTWIIKDYIEE